LLYYLVYPYHPFTGIPGPGAHCTAFQGNATEFFKFAEGLLGFFDVSNIFSGRRNTVVLLNCRLQEPAIKLFMHIVPDALIGLTRFNHFFEHVENAFFDQARI
jgi:hypothetical protein